jgi:hypothetical protein
MTPLSSAVLAARFADGLARLNLVQDRDDLLLAKLTPSYGALLIIFGEPNFSDEPILRVRASRTKQSQSCAVKTDDAWN